MRRVSMKSLCLAGVLAIAAVGVLAGTASAHVAVCRSTTSPQPSFADLLDAGFLHAAPQPAASPQLWNDGANIPVAVLTSKLPAAFQTGNLANEAGKYTFVCNPASVTTVVLNATMTYVDNNGSSVPDIFPYIEDGMPIPGVYQVYAAAAPPTTG